MIKLSTHYWSIAVRGFPVQREKWRFNVLLNVTLNMLLNRQRAAGDRGQMTVPVQRSTTRSVQINCILWTKWKCESPATLKQHFFLGGGVRNYSYTHRLRVSLYMVLVTAKITRIWKLPFVTRLSRGHVAKLRAFVRIFLCPSWVTDLHFPTTNPIFIR